MIYISRKKYYKMINDFSKLDDWQLIAHAYPKVFEALCCYNYRLPKRIVDNMFANLAYGNWERMWETDEDKKKTVADLCNMLKWEVFYISDRMSWDRLIRTHWIWQRICDRID